MSSVLLTCHWLHLTKTWSTLWQVHSEPGVDHTLICSSESLIQRQNSQWHALVRIQTSDLPVVRHLDKPPHTCRNHIIPNADRMFSWQYKDKNRWSVGVGLYSDKRQHLIRSKSTPSVSWNLVLLHSSSGLSCVCVSLRRRFSFLLSERTLCFLLWEETNGGQHPLQKKETNKKKKKLAESELSLPSVTVHGCGNAAISWFHPSFLPDFNKHECYQI